MAGDRDDTRPATSPAPARCTAEVRPDDRAWVDTYAHLDFPGRIDNPVDAVPPGFAVYTAVFHTLLVPDTGQTRRWVTVTDDEPWNGIRRIVDEGLPGWHFAADVDLDDVVGAALSDALGLRADPGLYTCGHFTQPGCTATGPVLAAALDGSTGIPSDLYFPHDRRWVAAAPFDAGWTYIGSDHELAERLRARSDLETLPCTYRVE